MLRHDHIFGTRSVELDGKRVHYSVGDGDLELMFVLCKKEGKLSIQTKLEGLTILFTYTCLYENVDIPPTAAYNVDKSTLEVYALCIPKYTNINDDIQYKIVSERSGSKCPSSVWRTYGEFATLRFDILSAFTGTEQYDKVPELPPNYALSLPFDEIEEEDIEFTRKGLETFLIQLKKMPQTGSNPDLLKFLGIRQMAHQNARTSRCAVNAMKEMGSTTRDRKKVRTTLSIDENDEDVLSYVESDIRKEALPQSSFSSSTARTDHTKSRHPTPPVSTSGDPQRDSPEDVYEGLIEDI